MNYNKNLEMSYLNTLTATICWNNNNLYIKMKNEMK